MNFTNASVLLDGFAAVGLLFNFVEVFDAVGFFFASDADCNLTLTGS